MLNSIEKLAKEFLKTIENKPVRIISHLDTDGVTSAAIIARTLADRDKKFSIKILKNLEKEILEKEIQKIPNEVLLFTDLASNALDYLANIKEPVFILDHHEIDKTKLHDKIKIINPHLFQEEELCGAGLTYLFSKAINGADANLAKLAIIGMIGDRVENISKINQQIINDAHDLEIKKGLLIFSATRPLRRSLEYSTSTYIPGVTGSSSGVKQILREVNISPQKTLYELTEEEMSRLVTAVMIRRAKQETKDQIIGNIYIINFFNRKEDIREISTLINSCSRLGHHDVAISFCLGNEKAKNLAQEIYIKYKQQLVSALRTVEKMEKTKGNGFLIINAREQIKDTIIGTVTSMLSSSMNYEEGTVLIGMAYNQDKVKVSARIVGRGRNLKEILEKTVTQFEAEVGGHQNAAGCLIKREDEDQFLEMLKQNLEIEVMKV